MEIENDRGTISVHAGWVVKLVIAASAAGMVGFMSYTAESISDFSRKLGDLDAKVAAVSQTVHARDTERRRNDDRTDSQVTKLERKIDRLSDQIVALSVQIARIESSEDPSR